MNRRSLSSWTSRRSRRGRVRCAAAAAVAVCALAATAVAPHAAADAPPASRAAELPEHALVGYLHTSFANGSGYTRLADVPDS